MQVLMPERCLFAHIHPSPHLLAVPRSSRLPATRNRAPNRYRSRNHNRGSDSRQRGPLDRGKKPDYEYDYERDYEGRAPDARHSETPNRDRNRDRNRNHDPGSDSRQRGPLDTGKKPDYEHDYDGRRRRPDSRGLVIALLIAIVIVRYRCRSVPRAMYPTRPIPPLHPPRRKPSCPDRTCCGS